MTPPTNDRLVLVRTTHGLILPARYNGFRWTTQQNLHLTGVAQWCELPEGITAPDDPGIHDRKEYGT
jgi:hypothetical protein